jgi:hypothetical protein
MAFQPYSEAPPEEISVQDRVKSVRAFSRGAAKSLVASLLDTGMLLVRTAQRMDPHREAHANCLNGARRCGRSAERELWKLQEYPGMFIQFTADIERLNFEIAALSQA